MRPSLSRACKRPCLANIPVSSYTPRTCKKAISVCKNTTSHIPMEELYVTTYAVIIETITLKVVGTYIPPSAPIEVFEATLNACPDVDLLFGDINVEFGLS
ncbi:hypothetical protein DSO57_1033490 [Entomophthora muscae]|uniref:Uncharacterized protein n=1 Tax=Entomophthora muscae TaxID=34485 RepID=A0ACC2RR30_9FUNG|nr:hypothetical protein DSO57_1033490 [Entomophthora muscae]